MIFAGSVCVCAYVYVLATPDLSCCSGAGCVADKAEWQSDHALHCSIQAQTKATRGAKDQSVSSSRTVKCHRSMWENVKTLHLKDSRWKLTSTVQQRKSATERSLLFKLPKTAQSCCCKSVRWFGCLHSKSKRFSPAWQPVKRLF